MEAVTFVDQFVDAHPGAELVRGHARLVEDLELVLDVDVFEELRRHGEADADEVERLVLEPFRLLQRDAVEVEPPAAAELLPEVLEPEEIRLAPEAQP